MLPAERRERICAYLHERRFRSVKELANALRVSESTIRRDLAALVAQGSITRTHGGAVWSEASPLEEGGERHPDPAFLQAVRESRHTTEKQRIGRVAASIVSRYDTVILDAGTTTREVARQLHPERAMTVVTDSVDIAHELKDQPRITVIVIGGILRKGAYNLFGPIAERTLDDLHVQVCVMGASGIDVNHGITKLDVEASSVRRKMITCSDALIVVADSTKFGTTGLATVASLDEVDTLVTDPGIPADIRRELEGRGIEVITYDE